MLRIGFDLDNTLVNYSLAVNQYCKANSLPVKNSIVELRNFLNPLDDRQSDWVKAQSWIYSDGLEFAEIENSAVSFIEKMAEENYEICILSHKSTLGPPQFGEKPFRERATSWLAKSKIGLYFTPGVNLFFYESLDDKVSGIKTQKLDLYVDDLLKVFRHPSYPNKVKSFIFRSGRDTLDWLHEIHDFKELEKFCREN